MPPSARHELRSAARSPASARYLIKPVRAASLAALLSDDAPDTCAPDTQRPRRLPTARREASPILVAEDNEINALLIRALLSQARPSP